MKKAVLHILSIFDSALSGIMAVLCLVFFLYGGYALFDTWQLYRGVYADQAELVRKYKPTDGFSTESLLELMAVNPDVCGWISLDGTRIDYPFVIGETNFTYLNEDVYRNYALSGSIFLDYRSARDLSADYTVFFGHHMSQGLMFGDLDLYIDKTFFEMNKSGMITLADGGYILQVVACVITDAYNENFFGTDLTLKDRDAEELFLRKVKAAATNYRKPYDIGTGRYVALTTCATDYSDARTVVIAQLIDPDRARKAGII